MKKLITIILPLAVVAGLFVAQAAPPPANPGAVSSTGPWTGVVSSKDGKYFLTQDGTKTTFELRGSELAKHAGQRVEITGEAMLGTQPAAGASHVLKVAMLKPAQLSVAGATGASGTASAGSTAGAGAAKAAGIAGASGLSKTAVAGLVVGGGAAGTVGSLYAADVIGDEDKPASRP